MSLHRTERTVLRSLHQHCKVVRESGGEDDGDVDREKLQSPVPDVNSHRAVLPLGYAWASLAVQCFSLLSPSRPFSWFIQISLSSRVSWSCESYSHFNINLVTHTHKEASAISPGLNSLNTLRSLKNSNAAKTTYFFKCILLELSLRWFLTTKKKQSPAPRSALPQGGLTDSSPFEF